MNRRLKALTSLAFAGILATAVAAPTFAADKAMVRALHASPDAPAVDVYVNDAKVLSDVTFKTLSDYLELDAGSYTVAIKAAGTDTVVTSIDATVDAGTKYTIAAIGMLKDIKLTAVRGRRHDVRRPRRSSASCTCRPTPAAWTSPSRASRAADAPVKDLTYPNATDYLALPAGTYDFEVRPTGTTTVALNLPGTALAADTNYTVFAVGLSAAGTPAEQALGVVVGVDASGTSGGTGSTETPPQTSTLGESSSNGSTVPLALLALALVAAIGVLVPLRRRFSETTREVADPPRTPEAPAVTAGASAFLAQDARAGPPAASAASGGRCCPRAPRPPRVVAVGERRAEDVPQAQERGPDPGLGGPERDLQALRDLDVREAREERELHAPRFWLGGSRPIASRTRSPWIRRHASASTSSGASSSVRSASTVRFCTVISRRTASMALWRARAKSQAETDPLAGSNRSALRQTAMKTSCTTSCAVRSLRVTCRASE